MSRNIFNGEELNDFLNKIIINKNIETEVQLKAWLLSNCKNFLFKNGELKEVGKSEMPQAMQKMVEEKSIAAPYHCLVLNSDLENKINHIVDYYKSKENIQKNWSRMSYEQASRKSNQWITELNSKISDEEDFNNLKLVYSFVEDGQKYTWVNMRSLKCLQREGKLMSNCVATYWTDDMVEGQISDFYSLRDDENNPIITLNLEVNAFTQNGQIKFFQSPEIEYKINIVNPQLCELSEDLIQEVRMLKYEKIGDYNHLYRLGVMTDYHHPDAEDLIKISIIEARQKYNELLDMPKTKLVTEFINNYFIAKIDSIPFLLSNNDSGILIKARNGKFINFHDEMLSNEFNGARYSPPEAYEELCAKFPVKNVLEKCFFEQLCFDGAILHDDIAANRVRLANIKQMSEEQSILFIYSNAYTTVDNCEKITLHINPDESDNYYSYFNNTNNSKIEVEIDDFSWLSNGDEAENKKSATQNYLVVLSNSEFNKITISMGDTEVNKRLRKKHKKRNDFIYIVDDRGNNHIDNKLDMPIFKLSLDKDDTSIQKICPLIDNDNDNDSTLTENEHFQNIRQAIVQSLYFNQECMEKELLSTLQVTFISSDNKVTVGNSDYSIYQFFNSLLNEPEKLLEKLLQDNKLEDIFDMESGLVERSIYFINQDSKHSIFVDNDRASSYMQSVKDVVMKNNYTFMQELKAEDDYALSNFLDNCFADCKAHELPITLCLMENIRDRILHTCQQIDNTTSNSIVSGSKTKIRQGRKNNVVRIINEEYGFSKDELNKIFEKKQENKYDNKKKFR